jgi:hypothetical protein
MISLLKASRLTVYREQVNHTLTGQVAVIDDEVRRRLLPGRQRMRERNAGALPPVVDVEPARQEQEPTGERPPLSSADANPPLDLEEN